MHVYHNFMEKEVTYTAKNTYSTLNTCTDETKTVWIIFHGIGYLSKHFITLFRHLDPTENYIIAPQAPAKYYKDNAYTKVGASWLTKENTSIDIDSVLNYVDAVLEMEHIPAHINLNILGYSQGVSIASRWLKDRKRSCNAFIMISGVFPKELQPKDFDFLSDSTKVVHIVGDEDPYFERKNVILEQQRVAQIIPQTEFRSHLGGHELNIDTIRDL